MSTTIDRGPGAADTSPHPDDLSTRDHSDHDGGAVGATAPLQRGAVLGRYIIVGAIGAGGMGTVYAAYDAELDRRLAIKVLNVGADSPSRSNRHQRLIREARALAKLSHPNVIPIYDVGNIGETEIFLAMELVTGGTLDGWVRGPERSWREIVAVYCAAGRGLSAAHAAGLVHRDFKPANVLVGGDRRPRVTDFGLVRTYASGRQSVSLNEDGDDG
ncbi:MAG: serine/threonine-protein kinase, partial [Myxococcota bacterium]